MITPANTALLIVDIQERLLPALHEHQAFLAACRQFCWACHTSSPSNTPKG